MEPNIDILRAILAFAFVLGLIWLLGNALRKYGWKIGLPTPKQTHEKRLSLVEIMALDNKNKLVIIRRDDVEHVLLIGVEQSIVVETITQKDSNSSQGNKTL